MLNALVRVSTAAQRGQALLWVIGLLFAATALVTGALALASSASISSRLSTRNLQSQYAAMGGVEHALYRLLYEPGYADTLPSGVPDDYNLTTASKEVAVTVLKLSAQSPPEGPDGPTPFKKNQVFRVTKEVTPTSAAPGVPTTFTYTITITNMDNEPRELKSIWDRLPEDFVYVVGSSSGISSQTPGVQSGSLRWNLGPNFVLFAARESRTQTFQAQATLGEGNYGNEAWVDPGGEGATTTGLTAKITAGTPSSPLWEGAHATIAKTVTPRTVAAGTEATLTYTITLTSTGADELTLTSIRDILPVGGITYVSGTTTGLTTQNPTVQLKDTPDGDRWQLTWSLSVNFPPGETKTLTFQASGLIGTGEYYNEVWATFQEISYELYSWPTATIRGMRLFEVTADDGRNMVRSQVWVGTETAFHASWQLELK